MFLRRSAFAARLLRLLSSVRRNVSGQSTVEAAFLIPLMLGGILLLVQPGIILYDRIIMGSAASQACRLLVTLPEGDANGQCASFVKRRLAAVPQQDCFHVHSSGCTWEMQFEGGETSDSVKATVSTKVKPLPLISFGATALGITDADGCLTLRVEQTMKTQPDWALDATQGTAASDWIGQWLE